MVILDHHQQPPAICKKEEVFLRPPKDVRLEEGRLTTGYLWRLEESTQLLQRTHSLSEGSA
jgi:hypothetical protein